METAIAAACFFVWLAVMVLAVLVMVKHGMFKQPEPCPPHNWKREGKGLICRKCGNPPGTW